MPFKLNIYLGVFVTYCDPNLVSYIVNVYFFLHFHIGKVYGCADCSKSFCTEADLKRHVAVHLDNKPFKCDKCQKTFTCKSSLNVHRRNHGEKKFACSYCNMHFHVPTDLSRHVTVHTGERPWRCAVCDKGYSCKSTLSVHIKQVRKP